jgi:hypothetical protein
MSNCACDDPSCYGWQASGSKPCVDCPGCGFSMSAAHAYADDKYGCTECGHGDELRGRSQRQAVIHQRVRALIALAYLYGYDDCAKGASVSGEDADAVADRLLASVDKPGESGGANPLP